MAANLNTKGFNQLMKSVAQRKARSRLLSSSARHQAQQRNGYITENGLDREDARKSRQELNETAGKTETKNLYQHRKYGVRDYVAEGAAKRTKAKNDAEYQMRYAQYQNTDDRMDDLRRGQRAIDRKGQQQKRAKKW